MNKSIRIRSILITLSSLAFLGIPGGSSDAGKSTPVLITVSGAIQGSGTDPAAMVIEFSGLKADNGTFVKGTYIANPNGSLRLNGTGRNGRMLSYYFCANQDHGDSAILCDIAAHDPWHYRRLKIQGGALVGKGQLVQAVFPANSSWEIWSKAAYPNDPPDGVLEVSGLLSQPVTYQETPLN